MGYRRWCGGSCCSVPYPPGSRTGRPPGQGHTQRRKSEMRSTCILAASGPLHLVDPGTVTLPITVAPSPPTPPPCLLLCVISMRSPLVVSLCRDCPLPSVHPPWPWLQRPLRGCGWHQLGRLASGRRGPLEAPGLGEESGLVQAREQHPLRVCFTDSSASRVTAHRPRLPWWSAVIGKLGGHIRRKTRLFSMCL